MNASVLANDAVSASFSVAERLRVLSRNLWWTWHPEVIALFREIDCVAWRAANHNPVAFLEAVPEQVIESRAQELDLDGRIALAFRRLEEYLAGKGAWADGRLGPLGARPVAYFSAEFGLHESLPIYSGGLGILAGDHLKSASDLGVPLVGVGLMYAQGYFRQVIDDGGEQRERYLSNELGLLPLARARDADGREIEVEVDTGTSPVRAAVWSADVGRSRLHLLDSNVPGNRDEDRQLTARLYGGDARTRIRQELLLGVGGMRALAALGIEPSVLHLNEGHTAFAPLEWARRIAARDQVTFARARAEVAGRTVFTTHTPVEAGHDRFEPALVLEQLAPFCAAGTLPQEELLELGRVVPGSDEHFCMTVLAVKSAERVNAVSAGHARIAREMWRELWPGRPAFEVPIGHVTNGVHALSWIAPAMYELYAEHLSPEWHRRMCCREVWQGLEELDDLRLWEARCAQRRHLLEFVRRRLVRQAEARREQDLALRIADRLRADALTIGFARRFAEYKRPGLLAGDLARLERLLGDAERPVQILVAGKAHPRDEGGKRLVRRLVELSRDRLFEGRLVFVEDHDFSVARHLVQGVDLWLNLPRPPREACGTSGQKVVLNGGLNLSVLDGWWRGAYDGTNGFAIGDGRSHARDDVQDARDAGALFDALEGEVVPLFFERDARGVPARWMARVKRAILTLAWRFNSDRMVRDYLRELYLPAAGGTTCDVSGPWLPELDPDS